MVGSQEQEPLTRDEQAALDRFTRIAVEIQPPPVRIDQTTSQPGQIHSTSIGDAYVTETELDWRIYRAVEDARRPNRKRGDATYGEMLREWFGEATEYALRRHQAIDAVVRGHGGPVAVLAPSNPPLVLAPWRPRTKAGRPPIGRWFSYAHARAHDLGLSPKEVLKPQQGRRASQHDAVKSARALIAAELRDQGATLRETGTVLGVKHSTIHELLGHAERIRQEDRDGQ